MTSNDSQKRLRSRLWFDDPGNPKMMALYLERYLNFGLTPAELQSSRPIIGIAQSGSDLVPCNRHHLQLAERPIHPRPSLELQGCPPPAALLPADRGSLLDAVLLDFFASCHSR